MLCTVHHQCAPSAANIQHSHTFLKLHFLCNKVHFIILALFKCFFHILEKARCIHHTWAKKPIEQIVMVIIMATYYTLILRFSMHGYLRYKTGKKEFVMACGEIIIKHLVLVLH